MYTAEYTHTQIKRVQRHINQMYTRGSEYAECWCNRADMVSGARYLFPQIQRRLFKITQLHPKTDCSFALNLYVCTQSGSNQIFQEVCEKFACFI